MGHVDGGEELPPSVSRRNNIMMPRIGRGVKIPRPRSDPSPFSSEDEEFSFGEISPRGDAV